MNLAFPGVESAIPSRISFDSEASVRARPHGTGRVSAVMRLAKHGDRRSEWLKEPAARRGFNRTIVALANKTARIAWALLTRNENYVAA